MARKIKSETATLDDLRRRAGELRAAENNYAQIGEVLGISPIRARDLVRQFELAEKQRAPAPPELSRRAKIHLVCGRHGRSVARLVTERFVRLTEIASLYTWEELLSEENVGRTTALEIRRWLEAKGLSLRIPMLDEQVALQPRENVSKRSVVRRKIAP